MLLKIRSLDFLKAMPLKIHFFVLYTSLDFQKVHFIDIEKVKCH